MNEDSYAAPADRPAAWIGAGMGRRRQMHVVLALLIGVLVVFWVLPPVIGALGGLLFPPLPAPPPPAADGSFAATQPQWDSLRFATVGSHSRRDTITADGKIALDDDRTTAVVSPYTGRVTRIFVGLGQPVKAGQALYAIAADEFAQGHSDLIAAQGAAATARTQLTVAEAAEARQHDLYLHQGAALKDWQQAQADLVAARGQLSTAEAARAAAAGKLGIAGASAAEIAGSGGRGEALVRAPVAGTITQRAIGMGQNISGITGQGTPAQPFTISDFSHLWVVGYLREEDAMRVHPGQELSARLVVGDHPSIVARLDYVAPMLDPASRRLTVRARIANPGGLLKPEMLATLTMQTGAAQSILTVPDSAVIYEGDTARVWVASRRDHRLVLRNIKAGPSNDGQVEVDGGLKPGEVVVTAGALFIDRGAHGE